MLKLCSFADGDDENDLFCLLDWIRDEQDESEGKKYIYHCCCNCCANNNRERERESIIVACSATAIIIIIDTFIIMGELELLLKQNNDHVDNQWMREREKKVEFGAKKGHACKREKWDTKLHCMQANAHTRGRPGQPR